jgi:aryl-alcohol dehydrogenase-like predicted oxidoreductase
MDFLHREVRALGGRTLHRLGLAANYGIDEKGIRSALDRGINFVFFTMRSRKLHEPLRSVMKSRRDSVVVSVVPTVAWCAGSVRRTAERALKTLGTDYLDIFQLGWLGVGASWSDKVVRELEELKTTGKVKAIGTSIHDRERAGKLAADSPLDMLMIRYNAAHPGAERDIFPHVEKRRPMIVAYTATRWRKLLKKPRRWDGPVMTAGDCYRFCLSNPNVDVVLTGPKSTEELDENLAALEKGPLTPDEDAWMRAFGKVVHG